jgi:hypothetical protein
MRRVALPKKKLNVIRDGEKTGEMVGVFHNLAGFIVENTPQKTDTEAYLSHSIREKLDARPEPESIDFEEAEIAFLKDGIDKLRSREAIVGSNWYFIIDALRSATDTKGADGK